MVGTVNDLVTSFMWPWLVAAAANARFGNGLGRDRAVPVVAHRIAAGKARQHGKQLRGEHPHDVGGTVPGTMRAMPLLVQGKRRGEVRDETRRWWRLAGRRWVGAKQLQVGGGVALAGIAARHEVGAVRSWDRS